MNDATRPVSAIIFASPVPLFFGAVLNDWAYASSYEIQWKNFANWLIVGGLLVTGLAIALSLMSFLRHRARSSGIGLLLWIATFVFGFLGALVHAKDAWAAMPAAMILSVVTAILAAGAAYFSLVQADRAGAAK